ncbi:hypothetical protein AU255_02010 [Methyloprofundus sedimenti]|uniref:Peptidase S1 domain-containing protein n=1 Tax=Methyloprofundus sedimenti TaxID=1420851 RepID=A0A1V8M568_9GAMM|nr:serine protease [Methyloprofundus sedimenti]OQK16705.1 hypothetical protein AU255_02010 [Methyloprofundus sedimenti]
MLKKIIITLLSLLIASTNIAFASERMAKIIGGTTADSATWPWMAGLIFNDYTNVFCGASLIAQDWILTAAHCVFDKGNTDFDVIINQAQLKLDSVNGKRIQVDSILIHPFYNNFNLENDLALIKLATPSHNTPINVLAPFTAQDNAGKPAIALGWGSMSTSSLQLPADLQQVDLPLIDNSQCNVAMMGFIIDGMLCAGDGLGERDTCTGDSGGPLVVFDTESGTWRQAGITSWGLDKCAAPDLFGVYTRLKNYATFISDHICTPAEKPAPTSLKLTIDGNIITASWNAVNETSGYRLNYAPYPDAQTIYSLDMNHATDFSVKLDAGSAFYVAITSYNGNCLSEYSNIEHFIIE